MKRILFALALGGALVSTAASAEALSNEAAAKDFAAANERALEGDAKGAIGLYQSLVERGVKHPEVYYNLGTALATAGKDVPAVVAFERSLRLDPSLEDAQANLRAVRARLRGAAPAAAPVASDEAGSVALADVLAPLAAATSATLVAWTTVFGQLLLFFGWWLARRAPKGHRRGPAGLVLVGVALSLVFGALTASHALVRAEQVTIANAAQDLRQGPDARFDTSSPVLAGARLRIVARDGAWLKVLQTDGTSGWIRASETTEL